MASQQEDRQGIQDERVYDEIMESFSNPAMEQARTLRGILSKNAETEYLLKYKLDGATDADAFKEKVPVSDYTDYKPFVDRILKGEKNPMLTVDPVTEIWSSSGTTNGTPRMYAVTDEVIAQHALVLSHHFALLKRHLPGLSESKTLRFFCMRETVILDGGLPCHPFTTAAYKNRHLRDATGNSYIPTSPQEVGTSNDYDSSMYCHLLLGLVQRDEVWRILANFPTSFIGAMKCLKKWWPEICDDIANASLSNRVKGDKMRYSVLAMLKKNFSLAASLRKEFSEIQSWNGIVQKLWPNVQMIDSSCNASMEAYFPIVTSYAGNVPVISSGLYGSTEMCSGLNLNPLCPANETSFTLFPSCAYFEFIPIASTSHLIPDSSHREIVLDLMSLTEGDEYELLVTTIGGLYRYRVGDVLKVVGFYKSNPTFKLMRRMHVVLSVDTDKTNDNELQYAVEKGCTLLEQELGLQMLDYTSCVDYSSQPGHYVIFLELALSSGPGSTQGQNLAQSVLEKCSALMEVHLGRIYRRGRLENIIEALELRIVEEGTFDLLARDAAMRGANPHQFKTPRGMPAKSPGLAIINARVVQSAVSKEKPLLPSLHTELT